MATAPQLVQKFGVGPHTAATLLVTAGDNPERLHNEAAFAALCGVSPLEASSGKLVTARQTMPCGVSPWCECVARRGAEPTWSDVPVKAAPKRKFTDREYIEIFYNRQRRHSRLGNVAPAVFAQNFRIQKWTA